MYDNRNEVNQNQVRFNQFCRTIRRRKPSLVQLIPAFPKLKSAFTLFKNSDDFAKLKATNPGKASEIENEVEEVLKKSDDVVTKEAGSNGEVATGRAKLDDIVAAMKADFPSTWKFNKVGDDAFEVLDGTGNKWRTVYSDKIVAPGRTAIGTPGNPILNKVPLEKSIKYDVDGFVYETGNLGRVLETTADLDDIARVRLGNQQIRAVDVKDGVRGADQGGHIIGSRFFGPGEQINLCPQSANLNQGAWKQMENAWADAMVAGKDVKVKIKAIFNGDSMRPDAFEVEYWIDGIRKREFFANQQWNKRIYTKL